MTPFNDNIAAKNLIEKQRWWDILSRMMEVLQLNLFIVDDKGKMILPPEKSQFGGKLIVDNLLNITFLTREIDVISSFKPFSKYYEYDAPLGLKFFAVPIDVKHKTIAYLLAGPVALNQRMTIEELESSITDVSKKDDIINQISSLRVVSHMMVNSILDLLYEVFKNTVDLALSEKILQQEESDHLITHDQKMEAEKLYARVGMDEMLVTLLDVALKITGAQSGSVMILDEDGKTLNIKAARGLDSQTIQSTVGQLGKGVAGTAVAFNEHYYIKGVQSSNNRITPYLKRQDIQNSLVMPLASDNKVFGVLNLNAKAADDKLSSNIENVRYLTRLITAGG